MALEQYKDKAFLYEHYVAKRMNMTDIVKLLEKNYNVKVSPQSVYNWCKKYDLPSKSYCIVPLANSTAVFVFFPY